MNVLVVETCKRLMDPGKYHAKIANGTERGPWGAGNSAQEAVDDLVKYHPELFRGATILQNYLPNRSR